MIRDYELACNPLDISFDALKKANHHFSRELIKLVKKYGKNNYPIEKELAIFAHLPNDQLVAVIRWHGLSKKYPQYFLWDGLTKEGQKKLLTPLVGGVRSY